MSNFIFDIGNVLIDFLPPAYLAGLFAAPEIQEALLETVFESPEWVELDRGTLTHAAATAIFCARRPDLDHEIRETMARLTEMLTPVEPTIALLPKIAAAGHRMYYLSNYHSELVPYIMEKYDWFSRFEGGVFSCDVKCVKPEPAIYQQLLDNYALNPADCVFFDDVQANVDGALRAGIRGIRFRASEDVEQEINR